MINEPVHERKALTVVYTILNLIHILTLPAISECLTALLVKIQGYQGTAKTLNIEAGNASETSVDTYLSTRRHILEDLYPHPHVLSLYKTF
jgi:hypothetical protein